MKQTIETLGSLQQPGAGVVPASGSTAGLDWLKQVGQVVDNIRALMREAAALGAIPGPPAARPDTMALPAQPKQQGAVMPDKMQMVGKLILASLEAEVKAGRGDIPIGQYIAGQRMTIEQLVAVLRQVIK